MRRSLTWSQQVDISLIRRWVCNWSNVSTLGNTWLDFPEIFQDIRSLWSSNTYLTYLSKTLSLLAFNISVAQNELNYEMLYDHAKSGLFWAFAIRHCCQKLPVKKCKNMQIEITIHLLSFGLCLGSPLHQGKLTVLSHIQCQLLLLSEGIRDAPEFRDEIVACFKPVMKRAFPDIDFAFLGYNIMRGYPLTSGGRDPGFSHRVKIYKTRSLGVLRDLTLGHLTSSFAPFGHSGRETHASLIG